MSKMKYSGVEWIGNIPKFWEIKKLKYLYKIGIGLTHTPEYVDKGVPFISVKDISSGFLNMNNVKYISESEFKTFPHSAIPEKGEIIFGRVGTIGCPIIFEENQRLGMFVSVGKLKNINPNIIYNKFFYYWMKSNIFEHETKQFVTGTAQLNLNTNWISNYRVIVPNIIEQNLIANFLDEKVTELDEILNDLNKQIKIINDYKKSIITEKITKGLNKNVEFKDSNINYIGLIPKNWNCKKLKYVLSTNLIYGANESGEEFNELYPRYIRITDIDENNMLKEEGKLSLSPKIAKNYLLKENDILFARSGATVGKSFFYKKDYGEATFAGYLIKASINNKIAEPKYVYYSTLGIGYENWKNSIFTQATIQNISADKYSLYKLPLPPLDEQKEIVDYLDKKCEQIDKIVEVKKKQIEKIEEYRKSVIYEYVSGKKRVEGAEELYG